MFVFRCAALAQRCACCPWVPAGPCTQVAVLVVLCLILLCCPVCHQSRGPVDEGGWTYGDKFSTLLRGGGSECVLLKQATTCFSHVLACTARPLLWLVGWLVGWLAHVSPCTCSIPIPPTHSIVQGSNGGLSSSSAHLGAQRCPSGPGVVGGDAGSLADPNGPLGPPGGGAPVHH